MHKNNINGCSKIGLDNKKKKVVLIAKKYKLLLEKFMNLCSLLQK